MVASSEKLDKLVDLEWDLFTNVQNRGGRAACQDNKKTFVIMRKAQASNWTDELIDSWTDDLIDLKAQGRNPMAEKYARMEQNIDPESYAEIELLLPEASVEVEALAANLSRQIADSADKVAKMYPNLLELSRSIHSDADSAGHVSFETYCRCELMSFSAKTLRLYDELVKECIEHGENLYEKILETTVMMLGYSSLAAAEAAAARSSH